MKQKYDSLYHIGATIFDPLAIVCHARRLPLGVSQPSGPYVILSREAETLELEIQTIEVVLCCVAVRYGSCDVPGNCVEKIFQQAAESLSCAGVHVLRSRSSEAPDSLGCTGHSAKWEE
jgi:hypothetical protein